MLIEACLFSLPLNSYAYFFIYVIILYFFVILFVRNFLNIKITNFYLFKTLSFIFAAVAASTFLTSVSYTENVLHRLYKEKIIKVKCYTDSGKTFTADPIYIRIPYKDKILIAFKKIKDLKNITLKNVYYNDELVFMKLNKCVIETNDFKYAKCFLPYINKTEIINKNDFYELLVFKPSIENLLNENASEEDRYSVYLKVSNNIPVYISVEQCKF